MYKTVKIKANEDIFNKWSDIAEQISHFSIIIQNDIEINEMSIRDWNQNVARCISELDKLRSETFSYLLKCRDI